MEKTNWVAFGRTVIAIYVLCFVVLYGGSVTIASAQVFLFHLFAGGTWVYSIDAGAAAGWSSIMTGFIIAGYAVCQRRVAVKVHENEECPWI